MDRSAVLKVERALLCRLLKLPAGARITGLSDHVFFTDGCYAVRVECESFPEHGDCHVHPTIVPFVEAVTGRFLGWNYPWAHQEMDYLPPFEPAHAVTYDDGFVTPPATVADAPHVVDGD